MFNKFVQSKLYDHDRPPLIKCTVHLCNRNEMTNVNTGFIINDGLRIVDERPDGNRVSLPLE